MTWLDTLVICLMALGLAVWLGEPLIRREAPRRSDHGAAESTEALLLQKETLYTALRDLDFDFQTVKVDEKDYTELRQQLESQALHILRQLDVLDPLARLDQDIELRVAALHSNASASSELTNGSGCPHCNALLVYDDHFCPFCGQSVRP